MKSLQELKHIRDSWADEHRIRIEETNRAMAAEKRALKRFKEADEAYQKARRARAGDPEGKG